MSLRGFVTFFTAAAGVLVETDFIDPCPVGTVAREVASTSELVRKAAETAFDSWVRSATDTLMSAGIEPYARPTSPHCSSQRRRDASCCAAPDAPPNHSSRVARLVVPLMSSAVDPALDPHPA